MSIVEIFCKDEMIWGGTMPDVPNLGAIVGLNFPATPDQVERAPEHLATKFYLVQAVIWNVIDGHGISQVPPKLQCVQVDPSTGKPVEPLVQTVTSFRPN